jgi:hypothetical protein
MPQLNVDAMQTPPEQLEEDDMEMELLVMEDGRTVVLKDLEVALRIDKIYTCFC